MARKKYKEYKDYLASSDWLVMKAKLINRYIRYGWKIQCSECGSQQYLQVHHESYSSLYKADEINCLSFLCRDCHKQKHMDGFKPIVRNKLTEKEWEEAVSEALKIFG